MAGITRIRHWWTKDTPFHSYIFCSFLIGIPFTVFNTYVIYQLQVVGFVIGSDSEGQQCTTYCIVPWGSSKLDLNSVLLYMNALSFGLGGAAALLISAYSDFWSRKHLLVALFTFVYGLFSVPAYWLQGYDERTFATLVALYVLFNIVTLILTALLQMFIPHCMRTAGLGRREQGVADDISVTDNGTSAKRRYGFSMSIWGSVAVALGGVVMLVITIILSRTLTGIAAQSSGLLITTVVGFITIAGCVVAATGLPKMPTKPTSVTKPHWTRPMVECLTPLKDLFIQRNLGALLIAYTIYVDSTFAVASVTGQLFIAEVHPNALEYSLYSLAQTLMQLLLPMILLLVQSKLLVRLEMWMIMGYALNIVVPIWGCIGFGEVDFGFKNRWEFYAQLAVSNVAGTMVNSSFRVLFSEMLPVGTEIQWFSMQVVLSCATVWVNYVASAPLQNATHDLRFPLVLSLIFLVVSFTIEVCRVTFTSARTKKQEWPQQERIESTLDVQRVSSKDG